ncbi:MAG: transcriptional regulator [Alphaproteobacteria bacterium]|nr:transcriptional regulator [Alphaproteobacteria bacterium]
MTVSLFEYRLILDSMHKLIRVLGGNEAVDFLFEWPNNPQPREVHAKSLPVVDQLSNIKKSTLPDLSVLIDFFITYSPFFDWRQTYSLDDLGSEFLKNYGWVEIIGERGAFASTQIAAGFLMLGANTSYPLHTHDAEELYIPLAGHAEWAKGNDTYTLKAPGTVIHHPSRVAHAMRTHSDPLIALYVWRNGDLIQKSSFVKN